MIAITEGLNSDPSTAYVYLIRKIKAYLIENGDGIIVVDASFFSRQSDDVHCPQERNDILIDPILFNIFDYILLLIRQ